MVALTDTIIPHVVNPRFLFGNYFQRFAEVHDFLDFEHLDDRWARAERIVRTNGVRTRGEDDDPAFDYLVDSQGSATQEYGINLNETSPWCECQDFQRFMKKPTTGAPDGWCKHRLAAWIAHERDRDTLPARLRNSLGRRIGSTMETTIGQAPFSYSLKVERDGSISHLYTARGDTAEELAERIAALKGLIPMTPATAPKPQASTTNGNGHQQGQPIPIANRQQAQAATPRPRIHCPQCGAEATFVSWTNGSGEHRALVCYDCNVWVNRSREGVVTTKQATGPLPTREPRTARADEYPPEDLPY